ncbi:MAG: fibronectin type III-like domain-contianing protein [Acidobacteriaceae bacterium]|nr:fibronectin type III-like domain-contianing protein [Acidobacteriaceae bacterium]
MSFTVTPDDLQILGRDMRWVVAPGTFDIMIGKSSANITNQGALEVEPAGHTATHK